MTTLADPAAATSWLTAAERSVPCLTSADSLFTAVQWFERDVDLRLIPVVDGDRRPVGAIFEKDVRRILLSPFGHALLSNPCFGHAVATHLRHCPVADASLPVGSLIERYEAAGGSEGMILTESGRLFAAISNRRLIRLAVAHEAERAERRIARARRIEAASHAFEQQVTALADALAGLAGHADANAGATAARSRDAGDRAAAVAAAAAQTGDHMTTIAQRGRDLALTLGDMAGETRAARASAADAVALVGESSRRTHDLLHAAQSIDRVVGTIGDMANQVNLLALNATIEAARAGEAGRGFTVVANAIKGLAVQARAATDSVAHEIGQVRGAIGEVVATQAEVEAAIGAIGERSTRIEVAAEAQAAATRHVAGNVAEVVDASRAITRDTAAIADSAAQATDSADEARALARRLLDGARALVAQTGGFLSEIQAA